jgi:D-glycero-alpha-D-manno-heptose 1-phosphate guanylyltransferase
MTLPEAVVLAGGLGTRLRSIVTDRQKVLVQVAGKPFLAYNLTLLEEQGCPAVTLALGYKGEQVEAAFGRRFGRMNLHHSVEETPAGTGGALRLAADYLTGSEVLVLNGDSILQDDYSGLVSLRRERSAVAAIAAVSVDDTARYGALSIDPNHRVVEFLEKGAEGPGLINAGVYAIETDVLRSLRNPSSLERDALSGWLDQGVWAWARSAPFIDIGTPASFEKLGRNPHEYLPGIGRRV